MNFKIGDIVKYKYFPYACCIITDIRKTETWKTYKKIELCYICTCFDFTNKEVYEVYDNHLELVG